MVALEPPAAAAVVTVTAGVLSAWAATAIQPVSASMPAALAQPAATRARRAGCGFGRRVRATGALDVGFVSIGLPSLSATRVWRSELR